MKVKFWGVRGSIPTPGPRTVRYGGNTPCIEIQCPGEDAVVIDAGTGIKHLGSAWVANLPKEIHLFMSHTHWDHIHGFPFFLPIYLPNSRIHVYGPQVQITLARALPLNLKEVLVNQMDHAVFPVMFGSLQAKISFQEIGPIPFQVGGIRVTPYNLNHTVITYGYNFEWRGKKVAYQSDHEPFYNVYTREGDADDLITQMIRQKNDSIVEMASGVDLLIADAMYTPEEYPKFRGWGHASIEHVVERAVAAKAKRVAFFHHDPGHDDDFMDKIQKQGEAIARNLGDANLQVIAAVEGSTLEL